jgi:hypothetical protein
MAFFQTWLYGFILVKMASLMGASSIHEGSMGFCKMEGGAANDIIAYMIARDEFQSPIYYQKWQGMKTHDTYNFRRNECIKAVSIFRKIRPWKFNKYR